ncbi:MAG: hypothetical protein ACOX9R_01665 [Armatimonadota bacterium]|jgi:outer membrane lipoprotein-sorting protein
MMNDQQEAGDEGTQGDELLAEPAEASEGDSVSPDGDRPAGAQRRPATIAVTALVVLAIIAIAIWALPMILRPDARTLLEEAVAGYHDAQEIHVESNMSYEMSMGDQRQAMELPTTAWFSRPNRMFFESGDETQRSRAVSDGEYLFLEVGMFNGVIKLPAPASFDEMPLENLSMSGGAGIESMKLPDIASILSGAFDVGGLASVEHGLDEGAEWLRSLDAPAGTWALTVRSEAGPSVAVWIDRTQRVVRKYAAQIDFDTMIAANPEMEQYLEQMPSEQQESFRQMLTRFETDVHTVELGRQPPEGTFAYEPAEGAEVVEADTLEEGIQKLLASVMERRPPMDAPLPPEDAPADE